MSQETEKAESPELRGRGPEGRGSPWRLDRVPPGAPSLELGVLGEWRWAGPGPLGVGELRLLQQQDCGEVTCPSCCLGTEELTPGSTASPVQVGSKGERSGSCVDGVSSVLRSLPWKCMVLRAIKMLGSLKFEP